MSNEKNIYISEVKMKILKYTRNKHIFDNDTRYNSKTIDIIQNVSK